MQVPAEVGELCLLWFACSWATIKSSLDCARTSVGTNQASEKIYTSAIHSLGILIWITLKRCFPATLGAALTVNVLAANEGRGLLKGRDFEEETNEDGPVDS